MGPYKTRIGAVTIHFAPTSTRPTNSPKVGRCPIPKLLQC